MTFWVHHRNKVARQTAPEMQRQMHSEEQAELHLPGAEVLGHLSDNFDKLLEVECGLA